MSQNTFYYTQMKPNEIYSAADEYLRNRSPAGNSFFNHQPEVTRHQDYGYSFDYSKPPPMPENDLYSPRRPPALSGAEVLYYQQATVSEQPATKQVEKGYYQAAEEIFGSIEQESINQQVMTPEPKAKLLVKDLCQDYSSSVPEAKPLEEFYQQVNAFGNQQTKTFESFTKVDDIYSQQAPETKMPKSTMGQEDSFFDLMMKYEELAKEASYAEPSSHTLENDVAKMMSTQKFF